jgi:hypothetical protein
MTKNLGIFDTFIGWFNLSFTGTLADSGIIRCFPKNKASPHEKCVTIDRTIFFNGTIFNVVDGKL